MRAKILRDRVVSFECYCNLHQVGDFRMEDWEGATERMGQAYDLVDYKYVACKLHRLNEQWSEEKKQTYVRHAIREYDIHKSLIHRHIVRLWDIFEIDHNTFCTVLEYCSGIASFLATLKSYSEPHWTLELSKSTGVYYTKYLIYCGIRLNVPHLSLNSSILMCCLVANYWSLLSYYN